MLPPPSVGIRMRSRLCCLLLLVAPAGCATVQVQVPVLPPPGLDLAASPQVAIAPLQGDTDGSLRSLLRSTLAMSSRFHVVSPEEAVRTSTAVLSGSASFETHEELKSFDFREGDFSTGQRTVHHFLTRTATGTIHAVLQAKDSLSGRSLGERTFEASEVEVRRAAPDMQPDLIAPSELAQRARAKFVAQLREAVAPARRLVEATFFQDGKLPQLRHVVTLAQAGRLDEAQAAATEAVRSAEKAGGDQHLSGMAHWNRAILEELRGDFAMARQDVQQAASDMEDAQLTGELQHINELEQQARKSSASAL